MAHVYSLTEYSGPPAVTLSLQSGGSLLPNTAYFYRVVTVAWKYAGSADRWSPASVVKSITTGTTNLSIQIDIVHSTGNPEYTLLWRHADSDPGTGNWNDEDNFPEIRSLHESSLYFLSMTGGTKIDTWTDDGTHESTTDPRYRLGSNPNYGFCPLREDGRATLNCAGGTEEDPISFDTIYDASIAQGWNEKATIEKLNLDDTAESLLGFLTGYRLNFMDARLNATDDSVFIDTNKLIILDGCTVYLYCTTRFGVYNSSWDWTLEGIHFHLTGIATAFGRFHIAGSQLVEMYDTLVTVGDYKYSRSTNYGGGFIFGGTDWIVIDFTVQGIEYEQGLNDGPVFSNGSETCLLKRFSSKRHRYAGQLISPEPFTVEDCSFNTQGGTGVISYASAGDARERIFSGVSIEGLPGAGESLYLRTLTETGSYRTQLVLIDSYVYDFARVRWYNHRRDPLIVPGSYCKLKYTLNVRVTDQNGAAIEGATVTAKNVDGNEEFSVGTEIDGTIIPQIITSRMQEPDPELWETSSYVGGIVTDYGPFTLTIEKQDFEPFVLTADITEAADWEISLKHSAPIYVDQILGTVEADLRATILDDTIRGTILDDTIRGTILDDTIRGTIRDSIE